MQQHTGQRGKTFKVIKYQQVTECRKKLQAKF